MHHKGQLDYVLHFLNKTPENQVIKIERTLKPQRGDLKPLELVSLDLGPGKTDVIKDRLTAAEVEIGNPVELTVRVTTARNVKPIEKKWTFKQLKLDEYLDVVSDGRELFAMNKGQPKVDCFAVKIVRKSIDPVTEPIFYGEIDVLFFNQPPGQKLYKDTQTLVSDRPLVGRCEILPGYTEIPYVIKVNNEVLKAGKFLLR